MQTIDAQVHAYERNHPGRPWAAVLHGPAEVTGDDMVAAMDRDLRRAVQHRGPAEVTGDDMVAAMDRVGVDGALLISPFTMYRYDASYAVQARAKHPGRF